MILRVGMLALCVCLTVSNLLCALRRCQRHRAPLAAASASLSRGYLDAMSAKPTGWDQLPLDVQQCILVLTGCPCARRVCKAWRDAFDAVNDTLCFSHVVGQSLRVASTAATMRVVKNSASLTAINVVEQETGYFAPPPLMLSDLLAAGATSGLATRLRKLTFKNVTVACGDQQLQVLRQCTGLTHLDISGSYFSTLAGAALRAMPRLTSLHVCGCAFETQCVVADLAAALQSMTQLQHLHLAGSRLGESGLAALAPALSAMPGLQTLGVSDHTFKGAGGAKALCTLLGAVPGLTHLDVSFNCGLQDEGAALLSLVLRGMTRLQTLNMSYISIGDDAMVTLAPALAALPHLHTLHLNNTGLGPGSASLLQPLLAREGSPLRELNLNLNEFLGPNARALASGLGTAMQLQKLSLEYTTLGDQGWIALAPSLGRLGSSLQSLQLGPDSLGVAGSAALASALKALTGLTCLQASEVFTSAAMVTMSAALMGMRRLQVLDLSGSIWGAEGIAAFAAAPPALAGSLKRLTLSNCSFEMGAAANTLVTLVPALAQATGLVELCLEHNNFGPQAAQWLVPVLRGLPHLRKVDLSSCTLGVQDCMAVARALKDRDGALVDLCWNDVRTGTAEGNELCNMPGINVRL